MSTTTFCRASWASSTNIYEVNLRQYTREGSFQAFEKEIPRLREMGVETLWFMPIHPIGEINRKGILGSYYSVRDFKDTNPAYGTLDDFKQLVKTVHASGMKVIIDWVANHAAWDNVWTRDHPDYFEHESSGGFKTPFDWTDVIQIDHSSTHEQDAMIDAMKFWVSDCDIDGFRADLAHLTPLEFWKKARTIIEPIKKNLFWLAETEEISFHEVFDASYTWEWMHKTEDYYKNNTSMAGLDSVLYHYETAFPDSAMRMFFTTNHDENSWNGTEYEKYGAMARALAVFSFTWGGIPMIYSGQELPNTKRLKFFEKDPIEWNDTYAMGDFYKILLAIKKNNPALLTCCPDVKTFRLETGGQDNKMLAYLKKNGAREILVILNLSGDQARFEIKEGAVSGIYHCVFEKREIDTEKERFIELAPWGYAVYEK